MDGESTTGAPAGLLRRLAALFYDALLVIALAFAATFAMLPFTRGEAILSATQGLLAHAYHALLAILVIALFRLELDAQRPDPRHAGLADPPRIHRRPTPQLGRVTGPLPAGRRLRLARSPRRLVPVAAGQARGVRRRHGTHRTAGREFRVDRLRPPRPEPAGPRRARSRAASRLARADNCDGGDRRQEKRRPPGNQQRVESVNLAAVLERLRQQHEQHARQDAEHSACAGARRA